MIDSKNMGAIVSVSHRNKERGVLKICSSLAFQVGFPVNTDDCLLSELILMFLSLVSQVVELLKVLFGFTQIKCTLSFDTIEVEESILCQHYTSLEATQTIC